jgi:hypothetical protein
MQDNQTKPKPGRPKGSKDTTQRKRRRPKDKPGRVKDLLHKRFGHLVVVSRGPTNQGKAGASVPALWYAQCDCGNMKLTHSRALCRGEIKTCGEKGCPFKAALHTENLKQSKDNMVLRMAIDKVGKVGFQLTADEVRTLLKAPCKLCGHTGTGHEIRCYEHSKGYILSNSYSVCKTCSGLVPITTGYHATWDVVLDRVKAIVEYLGLTGDLEAGVDKAFWQKVEAREKGKAGEEVPIQSLCY